MLRRIFGLQRKERDEQVSLIVGLGNPGPEYAASRHNVGFHVLDRFAERHRLRFDRMEFQGLLSRGSLESQAVVLVKPISFMNRSGQVVKPVISRYGVELERLLVIYDDLDLPLGKIRVRAQGGSGGHRGVKSIIEALGTGDFPRLRIGIGRPSGLAPDEYVLRDFSLDESIMMESAYAAAVSAVECFVREGIAAAMNQYN